MPFEKSFATEVSRCAAEREGRDCGHDPHLRSADEERYDERDHRRDEKERELVEIRRGGRELVGRHALHAGTDGRSDSHGIAGAQERERFGERVPIRSEFARR